jgi:hypothetical protein
MFRKTSDYRSYVDTFKILNGKYEKLSFLILHNYRHTFLRANPSCLNKIIGDTFIRQMPSICNPINCDYDLSCG